MKFTTLAFNPMCRMNEVNRYSGVYQETNESLSDHITDICMMSYLIARKLNEYGEEVNIGILLEKALLHDMDEVLTGDIPRNTKYATDRAHKELEKVAESAIYDIQTIVGIDSLYDIWSNAKSGKEGIIVKISDMLCVAKKAMTEVELRNNLSFLKVVSELESHLNHMIDSSSKWSSEFKCNDSYDFIVNIIKDARDEITTIRVKYNHIIEKYNIIENVLGGTEYHGR